MALCCQIENINEETERLKRIKWEFWSKKSTKIKNSRVGLKSSFQLEEEPVNFKLDQ